MSVWIPRPHLFDDERIRYQALGRSLGKWRYLTGAVTLTDRRIIFTPNRLDRITGGKQRSAAMNAIRDITVITPKLRETMRRFGFGVSPAFRTQIRIDDGTDAPFILATDKSDDLYERLRV